MVIYIIYIHLNPLTYVSSMSMSVVNDIDLKLMMSAEELKVDKSVFMNQREWELLHVLLKYMRFGLDNIDSYAEMKFNVSIHNIIIHYLLFMYS